MTAYLQTCLAVAASSIYWTHWRGVALTALFAVLLALSIFSEIVKARFLSDAQMEVLNESFDKKLNQHRDLISQLSLQAEKLENNLTHLNNAQRR